MAQMKERLAALSSRVGEVEQEAETTRKELIKTEEMNSKYQRDIREVRNSPHLPHISCCSCDICYKLIETDVHEQEKLSTDESP